MNECEIWKELGHDLVWSVKESTPQREVWNCICGYFVEESNDCGSGG